MSFSSSQVRAIVMAHVIATWFMVGLIWTIHVVHYPLFRKVGESTFVAYESDHVDRVGAVAMAFVLIISGVWSAPAHGELMDGFDAAVHDRLMTANLVRTLAWTVRGVSAVWLLALVWPRLRDVSEAPASS